MKKLFKNLLDNFYIQLAGLLAMFLSPVADAIGGSNAFWYLFSTLILLFIFGIFDEIKKNKIMTQDTVHIPIVIKVDNGPDTKYVLHNLIEKIEEKINLSNYEDILKKYYSINLETLIFEYNGSIYEFDRLINFTRIIKYKVNQIEKELNGRVKFHIAYFKRPSVGFILGTIFRTEAIIVYQNNDYENRFYPVLDINSRKYKENTNIINNYEIKKDLLDTNEKSILLVLNIASHLVNINAKNLKSYKNKIILTAKSNGSIPYDSDWIDYSREIYSIINQLQTEFNHIIIAHSMPESLAITLGMALENYWNITITQYENEDYKEVYKMNKIKYY